MPISSLGREWMNLWILKVFVEQPWWHRVCEKVVKNFLLFCIKTACYRWIHTRLYKKQIKMFMYKAISPQCCLSGKRCIQVVKNKQEKYLLSLSIQYGVLASLITAIWKSLKRVQYWTINLTLCWTIALVKALKLDGVGPVDNRPSTD